LGGANVVAVQYQDGNSCNGKCNVCGVDDGDHRWANGTKFCWTMADLHAKNDDDPNQCCNCLKDGDFWCLETYLFEACGHCKVRCEHQPPAEVNLDEEDAEIILRKFLDNQSSPPKVLVVRATTDLIPAWFNHPVSDLSYLQCFEIVHINCPSLLTLPNSINNLISLRVFSMYRNYHMKELPPELGMLPHLHSIHLRECEALRTPPPHIVEMGSTAMLQFLHDLAKGNAPCHLVKVVLLGNKKAGKSSLADSLVLGRPVTRADNDRIVGIDVRRWRVGGRSPLVANIYDAAGQRVYRATHGFFMSPGALFLHVVRCDMPEDASVSALLEWVEAVQQEAPGAVMGVVWTHTDWFFHGLCSGAGWQPGFLCVTGAVNFLASGIEMLYLHQNVAPCAMKDVGVVKVDKESEDGETEQKKRRSVAGTIAMEGVGYGDMQGKVALVDLQDTWERDVIIQKMKVALPKLVRSGALGLIVVTNDYYFRSIPALDKINAILSDVASIPIMLIREIHAEALVPTGVTITAFPGANSCCFLVWLPTPGSGRPRLTWAHICCLCACVHLCAGISSSLVNLLLLIAQVCGQVCSLQQPRQYRAQ